MCEAVGHPVVRLVRVRIGPLRDGSLKPGEWRALTQAEVRALYEAASATDTSATDTSENGPADVETPG
jgi:23S rRNA pseudouridine2605 synthase